VISPRVLRVLRGITLQFMKDRPIRVPPYITFSHVFGAFAIFHVKHACLPSLHHMPSVMNRAIVASYYSCICASNGYVQEKTTIMMDDVFIYHAHTFFALLCACVGCLDFVSTSTSRELKTRALESEPHSTTTLLHRTFLCFSIVKDAQGHAFEVISFSFENLKTMSINIVSKTSCAAYTMTHCTHVRHIAFTHDCHISMPHDTYALCVALWIICSYHMFGCNNVTTSHMSCPVDCHMLDLIASHIMNTCSFHCVECHTIFTTPYAHYAWFVLHLTHVFRHFIFFGVVNDSYAYHRPFIERFVHDCYHFEVDACSLVTHISISTSHLHACFHDVLDCAQFICLHAMSQTFVTL
jgi:hypothetical protein